MEWTGFLLLGGSLITTFPTKNSVASEKQFLSNKTVKYDSSVGSNLVKHFSVIINALLMYDWLMAK